jgi:hypothetical protein
VFAQGNTDFRQALKIKVPRYFEWVREKTGENMELKNSGSNGHASK